jgi:hypothetical protein
MTFRKVIKILLCTLVLLFVFCLGSFQGWQMRERLLQKSGVYVYDTKRKLDNYYQMMTGAILNQTGLPPESSEVKETIADVKRKRPIVVVGPFAIYIDNDSGEFSVHEEPLPVSLLELKTHEQSKLLEFHSSVEKGWTSTRFSARLFYSEDGVYERGSFAVFRKDVEIERVYFDDEGVGVFNRMKVAENGIMNTYRLNGFFWERVDE